MVLYSTVIISHLFSRCKCKEFFYSVKEKRGYFIQNALFFEQKTRFRGLFRDFKLCFPSFYP